MLSSVEHKDVLVGTAKAIIKERRGDALWADEYLNDSWESAWAFVKNECFTWNETNSRIERIPDKEYLRYLTQCWWETMKSGRPLIIIKSRRMVVSWLLRALDLWDAGRRRADIYIAAQTYPRAARMVWRNLFIYEQLRKHRPNWELPALIPGEHYWRYQGPRVLTRILLPNNSMFECISGESPEAFRQEGASRVVLEELAFYPYVEEVYGNALTMCQGKGGLSGHLVAVSTESMNYQWNNLKKP